MIVTVVISITIAIITGKHIRKNTQVLTKGHVLYLPGQARGHLRNQGLMTRRRKAFTTQLIKGRVSSPHT